MDLTVPPGTTTRLDSASMVQLQLIIQEGLTNIRKHSNASSGQVIFHSFDDELCVTIEDNGKGLNPLDIEKKEGFGFRSMRGRAKAIGATFDVISAIGEGTRLTIRVPYKKEKS